MREGRPNIVDAIIDGEIQMVVNTGSGKEPNRDGYEIRRAAIKYGIPYTTTTAGARSSRPAPRRRSRSRD
jgi:carbamoyl-phosphate synthase large subunit